MAKRVSMKQCKQARGLLKWNPRDLSVRSTVKLDRIMEFEHGGVALYKSENQAVYEAFSHAGIEFTDKGEVMLVKMKRAVIDTHEENHSEHHEQQEQVIMDYQQPQMMTPEQWAAWQQACAEEYHRHMMMGYPYPVPPFPPFS
jgi:hypothetical protein